MDFQSLQALRGIPVEKPKEIYIFILKLMNIEYLLKNKIMIQFGTSHYYYIIASARQSSIRCLHTLRPYLTTR